MNIPLNDDRLTAIATDALDDTAKPITAKPQPQAGLSVRRDGNLALFKIGENSRGESIEVQVPIENGAVAFLPARCASHRQILAAMGIDE